MQCRAPDLSLVTKICCRNTQRFVPKLPTPPPATGKSLHPVLHPDFATATDVSAVGNFTAPSLRHVQTPMRNMPSQVSGAACGAY